MFLYKKYGTNFLRKVKVNGMFAFILYDVENDIFVAGRDHIGMIPLYVGLDKNGTIMYASG